MTPKAVAGWPSTRRLRRGGVAVTTYLALPKAPEPTLFLPLGMPTASVYALETFTFPSGRARRLRNRLVRELLRRRIYPPVGPVIAVGHGRERRPELVAVAADLGVPNDSEFFVRGGAGDRLSRGAFFLFPAGERTPAWVLKFARIQEYGAQFDADEHGLALAEQIGATADGHAPRLVGRFEVDGRHASLETAAAGRPLGALLRLVGLDRETRPIVERVAAWIVEKDIRSQAGPQRLAGELGRLSRLAADQAGASFDVAAVDRLAAVPAVVLHHDLGCWNIVTDGTAFVALDWESARANGLPLWDLWYFLTDAAATADRVPRERRGLHLAALFRGEHQLSHLLFRLTREVVERLQIEPDVVGTMATLCWLHHAGSYAIRARELEGHGFAPEQSFAWPRPDSWLGDPMLGLRWRAWRSG